MTADEMIDRYIHEVGRHLPRKQRTDIALELRTLIQDALDAQTEAGEGEPTTKMTAAVLQEFGEPEEIAAKYRPQRHLIGPTLFPIYRSGISIAIIVITALHALGLLALLFFTPESGVALGQVLWNVLLNYGRTLFTTLGVITLAFAAVEYFAGEEVAAERPAEKAAWDPYQLPPVKDPDRINRFEVLVGILATLFFIALFNFFPQWIGFVDLTGEDAGVISLLAPQFAVHIPWLTALWSLEILHKVIVLQRGRWQKATRWLEFAVTLFTIYVLGRIFADGPISTVPFFTTVARGIIAIVILVTALEALGQLYRLLRGRPFSPPPSVRQYTEQP